MSLVLAIVTLLGDNQKATNYASTQFPNSTVLVAQKPAEGGILGLGQEQFDHVYIDEDWSGLESDSKLFSECSRVLKKNGTIVINTTKTVDMSLMIAGFLNIKSENNVVTAHKPNFSVGTAISLATKKQTVIQKQITLDLNDDNDDDLVGDEDLLEADDLQVPDTAQFDCGTGKTKKACKNCSCGLAEQEIKQEQQQREEQRKVILDLDGQVDTEFKSSCGSCYKGDAFRCESCPYLGMPAFKPGEKVLKLDLDSDL